MRDCCPVQKLLGLFESICVAVSPTRIDSSALAPMLTGARQDKLIRRRKSRVDIL